MLNAIKESREKYFSEVAGKTALLFWYKYSAPKLKPKAKGHYRNEDAILS